jgi:hypothetical protein
MDVPVQFFFEDAPFDVSGRDGHAHGGFNESRTEAYLLDFLNSRDGLELNKAFVKITDPKVRKRVVELVRALSDDVAIEAASLRAVAAESAD